MKVRIAVATILLAAIAAVAFQNRTHAPVAPKSLTAYVPQDALLSIESPDFAGLLHRWSNSAEAKSWLTSDSHAVFQNSRLFGRLSDAQDQFAAAAGIPSGIPLLNQVAGDESVFAWYDIGNLEFLYITRMPAAQSSQSELLQARAKFERRHAGNTDFYIRTAAGSPTRTVAFAQVSTPSGDLLLLATREDLMANALALIVGNASVQPLAAEPWFKDASAALSQEKSPPALHMVLNLDRIVPMPYFRSYWVQENVTWMRQFRSAVSDLYLEPSDFREERVLVPKTPVPAPIASPDLAQLASLIDPAAPPGVFRAIATTDPTDAVTAIDEKLLGASTRAATLDESAPDPDLEAPQTGSTGDLEVRIDALPPAAPAASSELLRQACQAAGLDAVMTLSTADPVSQLWIPIHSAVVLHAANPWNPEALAQALQQRLRGTLTTASLGIEFHPSTTAGQTIYALNGPRPLFFAVKGNLAIVSDSEAAIQPLLAPPAGPPTHPSDPSNPSTLIAGFSHTTQRAPFARLSALIDGTNTSGPNNPGPGGSDASATSTTPAFFSGNVRSLSDTFSTLESERITQRTSGSNLRQTVVYTWHPQ